MNELLMYAHGGSGNHGCEAIVSSLCALLSKKGIGRDRITVLSNSLAEDSAYGLTEKCRVIQERSVNSSALTHALLYAKRAVSKDDLLYLRHRYADAFDRRYALAVSIGGDNYCYPSMVPDLIRGNLLWKEKGAKTMLAGCSIEPELLRNSGAGELIRDLSRYDVITARETETYNALLDAGLTNVLKYPDPAFSLEEIREPLPGGFQTGNTLGINLSEMALEEGTEGLFPSVRKLIDHVLKETDMSICLIPHVVWKNNDDRKPLTKLLEIYGGAERADASGGPAGGITQGSGDAKPSGESRVFMLPDAKASVQKGYISRLRFFVGARTHSVIAAYSTGVPALALGYSVKARALARDIFGSDEDYVIPVQKVNDSDVLTKAFIKLMDREQGIRADLSDFMPDYIKMAAGNADVMARLLSGG